MPTAARPEVVIREEVKTLHLYDVLIIVDPRHTEEEVVQLATRLAEACRALGAEVGATENWGKRRLAYELRKQREGTYVMLQVRATPAIMREYERQLRLNEAVLRFMTTRVDERRRKAPPGAPEGAPESVAEPAAEPAGGPPAGEIS